MCIDHSFIVKPGDPNRENINPDKLGTLDITGADEADNHGLFDFFARYVRKVHSDEFIRKTLKLGKDMSFIDVIGPNDIAYVIAVFKNSQKMWDQENARVGERCNGKSREENITKFHKWEWSEACQR